MDSWGVGDVINWVIKGFKLLFKGGAMTIGFLEKRADKKETGKDLPKKKRSIGLIILKFFIVFIAYSVVAEILPTIYGANRFTILLYSLRTPLSFCWLIYIILQVRKASKQNKQIIELKTALNAMRELSSDIPCGVMFGKKETKYIVKSENMDGHVLVVGGVGSGKSSCVAIPSLRSWGESVFAIDIKGELYEKTKLNRPNIKVFNPLDENSYGYDPFLCLHTSQNPSQEARAIAQAIIPLPHEIKDPFWIESAQNIFMGAILHYSGVGMSFIETIEAIQSTPPRDLIEEIFQSGTTEARYCVNSLIGIEDKTLSGIMAEVSRSIIVFVTDKSLRNALSRQSNITPADLEMGNDIYIHIPEHLLRQWKNLLTLIVNQFLTHFEQRSETDARPILFLLDEFPRLGKVSAMLDGLATLRSKKIVICLIIQSLAQLDVIYGQNERKVILDTCPYSAILGVSDGDTQEYFSKMVGTYDKEMTAKSKHAYTGIGTNETTTEQEKRIIKPEEFGRLRDIVLLTPLGFFRVDKAPYYEGEK